jgi:hypothetical protein
MKLRAALVVLWFWAACWTLLSAQETPGSAAALYRRLGSVGLDATRVYRVRDASIEREDIHLSLNDGVIAFTQAIDGRITGALFEGDGDILISPPDRVERWSLSQFIGAAILEERFTSVYLRFNDDLFAELQPRLHPFEAAVPVSEPGDEADEKPDAGRAATPGAFVAKWNNSAQSMARVGALRLLQTFIDFAHVGSWQPPASDRFLTAQVSGGRLGTFLVNFDSRVPEQILAVQARTARGVDYYDVWTSFPMRSVRARMQSTSASVQTQAAAESFVDPFRIPRYTIRASILPPRNLRTETTLDVEASEPGHRMLVFELSHFLRVKEVTLDSRPLEFVQNESLGGSELANSGNDRVAVILPQALTPHMRVHLRFVYEGEVLSDAGGGLMYVGARGIWYPNRGFSMSDFDMEFRYPSAWTLVATGKRVGSELAGGNGEQVARYVSERPMPVAGFNIGLYKEAEARSATAVVRTYAARSMESSFPRQGTIVVSEGPHAGGRNPFSGQTLQIVPAPPPPSPVERSQQLANYTAQTVDYLADRLGRFPYSTLSVTQIPGGSSQSWPGLVYLSGYSFLPAEELAHAGLGPMADVLYERLMPAHETAHQWWGDLLIWNSYREQWLVEALSNYCVLLMLEQRDPKSFRAIMEQYRRDLLFTKDGHRLGDAGPVTLGVRLNSSRFPQAYQRIAYGRGTWLFHMLHTMLLDASSADRRRTKDPGSDLFFTVLRQLRERYEGRDITTRDVQRAFEQALPDSLRYEGHRSLEWFFDNWVNGTAVPELELARLKLTSRANSATATVHITQKHAPADFVTSVPVYAETTGGSTILIGRVYAEGPDTAFRFTVPKGTRKLLLDPYQTVLRKP